MAMRHPRWKSRTHLQIDYRAFRRFAPLAQEERGSEGFDDLDVAGLTQNFHFDDAFVAADLEIDAGIAHPEIVHAKLAQIGGHARASETNLTFGTAHTEAKTSLQQHIHRARRPSLRGTCDRIESSAVA